MKIHITNTFVNACINVKNKNKNVVEEFIYRIKRNDRNIVKWTLNKLKKTFDFLTKNESIQKKVLNTKKIKMLKKRFNDNVFDKNNIINFSNDYMLLIVIIL